MSQGLLQMEERLLVAFVWEAQSPTSVLVGSSFLKIKPAPVYLMESGQELNHGVNVRTVP